MADTDLHYPMSCPFCGHFPVMTMGNTSWDGRKGMYQMRCNQCDARGPTKLVPGDAADAWDQLHFRRRATDRDYRPDDGDDPEPGPKPPVTPRTPETVR